MLAVRNLTTRHVHVDTLDVDQGECVAIMGASGAGKTLLLRAIADLDPNSADVRLGNIVRAATPAPEWRRLVAYVPAESGWWADGVADHFADPPAARHLLHALGLPSQAMDWKIGRLSTGERQRLALARALAVGPGALLLDEPTSSLDATATTAVELLVAQHRDRGLPVVVVTHDPAQAGRMADRIIHLAGGAILPEGADP